MAEVVRKGCSSVWRMLSVVMPDLYVSHAPYSDRSCSDLSEGQFSATSATATSSGEYDNRKRAYLRPVFSE